MSTMPGRRLDRVTGSNNNPVADPPSGLLKEMALTSTRLGPVRGGLGSVDAVLGSASDPPHAEMNKAARTTVGFINALPGSSSIRCSRHRGYHGTGTFLVVRLSLPRETFGPGEF
jgi:hypothetical protein